jgi:translation initiation factor 2-alpha kinase 4
LSGDPQIGDFGLATNDLVVSNQMSKVTTENSSNDNELTTNVGTALYVAPELRKLGQGNYNEKVDVNMQANIALACILG